MEIRQWGNLDTTSARHSADSSHAQPLPTSETKTLQVSEEQIHEYVPRNYIGPEVYKMIAAFETWSLQHASILQREDAMALDHKSLENSEWHFQGNHIEPMSTEISWAPPKRFYLTFWRSLARKAVLHHHDSQKFTANEMMCYP